MQTAIQLPTAFSVQNEDEFFPIQHLLARMNVQLIVEQVATGVHCGGGCTVFWGLVYLEGQRMSRHDVEAALRDAGFDFTLGAVQELKFCVEPAVS